MTRRKRWGATLKNGMLRFFVPLLLALLLMVTGVVWLVPAAAADSGPAGMVANAPSPGPDLPAPEVSGGQPVPTGSVQFLQKLSPADQSVVTTPRPTIYAVIDTKLVGAVDPGSVHILVNGQDVTSEAMVSIPVPGDWGGLESYVKYTPPKDFPDGTVTVFLKCASGQHFPRALMQQWSFTVHSNRVTPVATVTITVNPMNAPPTAAVNETDAVNIQSFKIAENENPVPGDRVALDADNNEQTMALQKLTPADQSVATSARPTIRAEIVGVKIGQGAAAKLYAVDSGSVRLLVNGKDVTTDAVVRIYDEAAGGTIRSYILYNPPQDLPNGPVTVRLYCASGQHFPGRTFQQHWGFTVQTTGVWKAPAGVDPAVSEGGTPAPTPAGSIDGVNVAGVHTRQ